MQKEIDKLTAVIADRKPDDPMHHQALRSRAETFSRVGRHREALEDAQRCIQLAGPDSSLLLFCATQKMAIGDLEGSLADVNRALAKPDREEQMNALRFRSRLLKSLGKDQASDADLEVLRRMSGE